MRTENETFELLRRANPLPPTAIAGLAERTEAIRLVADGARVAPRPRRTSRVRVALAFAALSIAFLLVAPALGLDLPPLDFWQAEKAPAKVVRDFEQLGAGAPEGMDPGAIPGETRKVATVRLADGPHTLWVSPTRAGGFCLLWTNASGGCDKLGTVPLSVSWSARRVPAGDDGPPEMTPLLFDRLAGHVNSEYAESVEIRFVDGSVVRPEPIWVSEPIGAGFFVYDIPDERRIEGREISAVVALDREGNIVAEDRGRPRESTGKPPVEAVVADREAVARIDTRQGEAVVWEAPTRYEGRCVWLEFAGRSLAFQPCMPKGHAHGPFAFRFVPTASDVLLVGTVRDDVASVELRFVDGERIVVHPQRGFVLYELPSDRLVRGREASEIVSRDVLGKALHPAFAVGDLGGSRFACLAPLPLEGKRSGPFCL